MPRDGSHVYSVPGGTDGVPDQPVYSTPYNAFVHDVEQDLNAPRPILAGGTGAINERDAMVALKGEIAKQFVDNFDMYPFVNGSWYSEGGATGAPLPASAFTGIYYEHLNTAYATIEAREISAPGRKYIRQKIAGVWQAWVLQVGPVSDLDGGLALKVSKSGDTMSGTLTVSYAGTPQHGGIVFGNTNHYLYFDGTSNTFSMNAPLNLDTLLSSNITTNQLLNKGAIYTGYAGAVGGTMYFGSNNTSYLTHDGTNFSFAGGGLYAPAITSYGTINATGQITAGAVVAPSITSNGNLFAHGALWTGYGAAQGGVLYFGNNNTKYLQHDGNNRFNIPGEMDHGFNAVLGSQFVASSGVVRFQRGGAGEISSGAYLFFDGANYTLTPGKLNLAGLNTGALDTTGQVNLVQNQGGVIYQGNQGAFMIQNAGGGNDAMISLHNAGAYAINFGLSSALGQHLGVGGWSMGAGNVYKVWTGADFNAAYVGDVRLVYVGDYGHVVNSAMTEPYGANACVTGSAGFENSFGFTVTMRYRQLQILTPGGWAGVGTA
jgi:hypothetical protein